MSASEEIFNRANPALCERLTELLPALLTPDSATIKEATESFKKLSSDPAFIPSLTRIITSEQTDENSRKLAAVLFRKRVVKQWKTSDEALKKVVRQASLEFLVSADEKVYKHLAEVVAGIAEHELKDEWEDLWSTIAQLTSGDYGSRFKGTELLKCVCQTSVEAIFEKQLIGRVLEMIHVLLQATDVKMGNADKGQNVHKNVIDAFNACSVYFDEDQKAPVRKILPRMVDVVRELCEWDDNVGSDAMSMFTNLCESEDVKLVNNELTIQMATVSRDVAMNENYEEETRANALSQLQMLIKYKKHAFTNNQILKPLAAAMIHLVKADTDPDDGIMSGGDGDRTTYTGALQVLDQLAMNVPAEAIMASCMQDIAALCSGSNALQQRAGLLILSVIVEGCADLIMADHIDTLVKQVVMYMTSPESKVRSAAYFTIGQFAEHLVPDIADFAKDIMPQLMRIVQMGPQCEEFQNRDVMTKVYYALESFIESLGGKPNGMDLYAENLMTSLLTNLTGSPTPSLYILECVVGTIGAVASATDKKFAPFLESTIKVLQERGCFPTKEQIEEMEAAIEAAEESGNDMPEDKTILWSRSLQTLSSICRAVGDELFLPYAQQTLDLAIVLSGSTADPDIRGASFSLFGALGAIMKDKMAEYMETIAGILQEALEDSVLNLDGADGDENRVQDVASMLELSRDFSNESEEGDDIDALDMENLNFDTGPIEAKIAAMETVGELAEVCPNAFRPYMEQVYQEAIRIKELEGIIHEEIMRAALCCAMIMSAEMYKVCKSTGDEEGRQASLLMARDIWPSVLETISNTNERQVCMSLLYHLEKSIQCNGSDMLSDDTVLKMVCEVVHTVLSDQSACQKIDDDTPHQDGEADQAEHDQLLIEYACDILPTTCLAIGGEAFVAKCWPVYYPVLKKRALNKKAGTTRAAALGAMADIMKSAQAQNEHAGELLAAANAQDLVPVYMNCLQNKENNVRNNAIYGLGLIVSLGISKISQEQLIEIMGTLWNRFQVDKADNVKDQVLGAAARLVIAIGANSENFSGISTTTLIGELAKNLPVKTDPSELAPVALCFEKHLTELTQEQQGAVLQNVISMSADFSEAMDDATKLSVTRLMKKFSENDKFSLLGQLSQEQQDLIQQACI